MAKSSRGTGGISLSKQSSSSSEGRINIYRLKDPTPLCLNSGGIIKAMLPRDVRLDNKHLFYISPASGWMGYTDRSKMWQPVPSAAVPQDSNTALAAAKKYIADVGTRIQENVQLVQLGITAPFVDSLTPEIVAVSNPNSRAAGIDHWLCRFQATLDSGAAGKLPIIGALIEVRIGWRSAVIGFSWRWRFVDPKSFTTSLVLPPSRDASAGGDSSATLVYLFADQGVNQNFLAPYYMSSLTDDSPQLSPASQYSLLAELSQAPSGDSIQITCQAWGGSGNYTFDWCCWSPLKSLDSDLTPPSHNGGDQQPDTSSIKLPFGIYNVIVNVTDTNTNANIQIQRSCYLGSASPAEARDQSLSVS